MSVPQIQAPAMKMQIAPTLMVLTDVIADKDLLEVEKPVKVYNLMLPETAYITSIGFALWEHFILQPRDNYFLIFILHQMSTSVLLIPVPVVKMLTVPTVTVLIIVLVNRDSLAMERLAMVSD